MTNGQDPQSGLRQTSAKLPIPLIEVVRRETQRGGRLRPHGYVSYTAAVEGGLREILAKHGITVDDVSTEA